MKSVVTEGNINVINTDTVKIVVARLGGGANDSCLKWKQRAIKHTQGFQFLNFFLGFSHNLKQIF